MRGALRESLLFSQAGSIFWFMRKRLSGSYLRFTLGEAIVVQAIGGAHAIAFVGAKLT